MSRLLLPGLAVFAFLTFSAGAQDLKDLAAKQKIAAEKLGGEVKAALERSRQLEKTDAVEAKFLLQRTLRQVKDSSDLLERERTPLVVQLQTRLTQVEDA